MCGMCCTCLCFQPKPIEVQVITHHMQRYAVWFGGSMLASAVSSQVFVVILLLKWSCEVKVKLWLNFEVFSNTILPCLEIDIWFW